MELTFVGAVAVVLTLVLGLYASRVIASKEYRLYKAIMRQGVQTVRLNGVTIRRYVAFDDIYGCEEYIHQVVVSLRHADWSPFGKSVGINLTAQGARKSAIAARIAEIATAA